MRGSDVLSRYILPLRIIPEAGQVPANSAHPSIKQLCDVLHDNEPGSKLANKTGELGPQAAAGSFRDSRALAGGTDVLTGESAADDINGNSVCPEPIGSELLNVSIDRNLGPVLAENAAAELIDLAERDGLEPARAFQAEVESADAREKREHLEF
jgi:hypothetical protein